ncbi:MAG: hypothetical protein KF901_19835 [Myxococcales bacterium]|nr:hypothetical protein [Myxococcales bacterium]
MTASRPPSTHTERLLDTPDPERVFQAFVKNALAVARQARTARVDSDELDLIESAAGRRDPSSDDFGASAESTLPEVKTDPDAADVRMRRALELDPRARASSSVEALVPDVAAIRPPDEPVPEGSEDGQIPARELDRRMSDMAVLLRYGHRAEVAERLDELLAAYPEDLLLLRRIAEFHLEHRHEELAKECLFKLATGLFERRNVAGMRLALEQVLVLEPGNARATKLLGLLERRDG